VEPLALPDPRAETSEEVNALRSALLLAVSHDFRTPLTTIKAYVSGLLRHDVTWTPDELAEAHSAIDAEGDRLNQLVGNLLDAGRLEAGVLAVAMRPTPIEELTVAVAATFPSTRVMCTTPQWLPLVKTDPTLLERVLVNLLANADRYGPASVPIEVDIQLVEARIHLRVVDHGPGIAEDRREAVFQPFQRFNDTTRSGTGLGLAITSGFIEAVDATLSLEDTPGGGLTATVTLPLAESDER
jgi:two-component system sensor histidine kinase KdpD